LAFQAEQYWQYSLLTSPKPLSVGYPQAPNSSNHAHPQVVWAGSGRSLRGGQSGSWSLRDGRSVSAFREIVSSFWSFFG
jgi:hypothetical protein